MIPTFDDVRAAQRRIEPCLRATPVYPYPALGDLVGADVWVKHENHQPVGAFKVRGGVNLVSQLSDEERARGLVSASDASRSRGGPAPWPRDSNEDSPRFVPSRS